MTGYRLHWEGSDDEPEAFSNMKEVREKIREEAAYMRMTIAKATDIAYIITEDEYQEEQEVKRLC